MNTTSRILTDNATAGNIMQHVIEKATGHRLPVLLAGSPVVDDITITDTKSGFDYYEIAGQSIFYSGDMAMAAVGQFCEKYFGAVWLYANMEALHVNRRTLPIRCTWAKEYVRPAIMRVVRQVSGIHAQWLSWHHISPKVDEVGFHQSWFRGLALKYPQVAPTRANEESKINLLHDDTPAILYKDWLDRGKPSTYSLFEIDGNGYWWCADQYDYSGLDDGTAAWFRKALTQGLVPELLHKATPEAQEWWKRNVRSHKAHKDGKNRVSHSHLYLQAYVKIAAYFASKGATCRFRVLAYAAYYLWPDGMPLYDLSNFDVYLCPPETQNWYNEARLMATRNTKAWAKSGAKIIFRPNLFQNNHLPVHRHNQLAPFLIQLRKLNGGLFLTSNYLPGVAPLDWYIRLRIMYSGKGRQALANEFYHWFPASKMWTQEAMAGRYIDTNSDYLNTVTALAAAPSEAAWEAALAVLPQLSSGIAQVRQALRNHVPDEA